MVTKFERLFFQQQVYSTFSVKNEEFSIEDLPEEKFEDAVEFMIKNYVAEETFMKAFKVPEESLREFYRFVFKQRTTIVCFKKGSSDIIGMNALSVKAKGVDTSFKAEEENLMRMRLAFAFINSHFDVFDHNNVIYFLYAHGLAIRPDYRGWGIASEILKARIPFMRLHNLTVTSSLFTTLKSQQAALKNGYSEDLSISYKIIKQKYSDIDFSSANCDDCKLLTLKI